MLDAGPTAAMRRPVTTTTSPERARSLVPSHTRAGRSTKDESCAPALAADAMHSAAMRRFM
jgi:hypothetical protein